MLLNAHEYDGEVNDGEWESQEVAEKISIIYILKVSVQIFYSLIVYSFASLLH